MEEMEIRLEDCDIDIGDEKAVVTIVLLVEFDEDDYIYNVESIEHGNEDEGDLMILGKRFMSKEFVSSIEKYVDHPIIREQIRDKTQDEWQSITEPDYDYKGYDYE